MQPLTPIDRAEYERSNPSPSAVSVSAAEPLGGGARKPVASDFVPGRHHHEIAVRIAIALVGLAGCVVVFAMGWA